MSHAPDTDDMSPEALGRKFPIFLVPYDPHWPAAYAAEAAAITAALGPHARRIEHIGSTAIPGLEAKPTIDMLLEVPSLDHAEQVIGPLLDSLSYAMMRVSQQGPAPHILFAKGYDFSKTCDLSTTPKFHLHAGPADHPLWERIAFRDYLRQHPAAAAEYAALKRTLAAAHRYNRETYTAAKTDFVRRITDQALASCR